jgi:hypothetical protein
MNDVAVVDTSDRKLCRNREESLRHTAKVPAPTSCDPRLLSHTSILSLTFFHCLSARQSCFSFFPVFSLDCYCRTNSLPWRTPASSLSERLECACLYCRSDSNVNATIVTLIQTPFRLYCGSRPTSFANPRSFLPNPTFHIPTTIILCARHQSFKIQILFGFYVETL